MENVVYNDYASWIIENSNLFESLKQQNSIIYTRFKHVFDVVSHLYELLLENKLLDDEQNNIFEVGFYYLYEQFENVKLLLEHTYEGDIVAFNKQSATIELLLSTIEFENDFYNVTLQNPEEDKENAFVELEQEIIEFLERKEDAPQELFEKLDKLSAELYEKHDLEYYPIKEIFLDIAEELNLL
ncbi:MAG: hypothetical protein GX149_04910 [Acholeplasmataceae bacterium]|jgi:hypothetical protein|nr:hypothetical protein [Acholeplasmataceae bacterium]